MTSKQLRATYILIPFLFFVVYYQIFFVNYAYLDEIYFLWHNNDDTNFRGFLTQGRWLTGIIFQRFFSSISTIEQIKILRLFSMMGWIGTAVACSFFIRQWTRLLKFSEQTWWLSSVYVACSLSVCIYIGFTACLEVFLAVIFALLSGHIFFTALYKQQKEIHLSNFVIIGSLLLALVSLFIYQPSFGIFLVPFFLYYIRAGKPRPNRVIIIAVIFYFIAYIIYYFSFKYSLRAYHLEASDRTEIHFNFLRKLSFFFAGPFPQGFSLNLLFSAGSISSQIFYPFVFTIWLLSTFRRNRANGLAGNSIFVAVILFFLAMIYLPSMIAAENFPSYRTTFVFDLAVFLMVFDNLLYLFKKEKRKWAFTILASFLVILTGVYAFNVQFINPLKKEYSILRNFFDKNYNSNINAVYFIRADKFLFSREFETNIYRDEFGAPSTYRDWVPEPIVRQMILELTQSRKIAEQTMVTQFETRRSFDSTGVIIDTNKLLIDMNSLFKE